jgi:hypothetical protein
MQERGFVIFKCLIFRLMQNVNETFSRDITQKQAKGFMVLIKVRIACLPSGMVCRNHSSPPSCFLLQTLSGLFSHQTG